MTDPLEARLDLNLRVADLEGSVDWYERTFGAPPIFRGEDPVALTRQALFLQEVSRTDVEFEFSAEDDIGTIACDRHQFGQAMTNVLKNAVEAIEARQKIAGEDYRGRIAVALSGSPEDVIVSVSDNGIGLPQDRDRIAEPYVTTREKGTGLGLAIVKKIVEEHGGEMGFASGEPDGTVVTMRFARDPLSGQRGSEAAE